MESRPIAPETWEKLPPEVQAYILFLEHALRQSLARIAQLEQRVNELEARFNRHSGNSSQPPSQDPPQSPRNRKQKSGRKPGGQQGHQGNHREMAPPEKVNKIVEHRAETCPHCRNALKLAAARPAPPVERHQVWELPEIHPVITEHRLLAGWCPHCQTWVKPDLPPEVGRSAFGSLLQAWVAILTGRFRQSRRQVAELLRELCGVSVSLGRSIQSLCEETSEALAVPYREAKEAVAQADMAHLDETGWKEKGKRHWLWVAVTKLTTVFMVSCSRGRQAFRDVLGRDAVATGAGKDPPGEAFAPGSRLWRPEGRSHVP